MAVPSRSRAASILDKAVFSGQHQEPFTYPNGSMKYFVVNASKRKKYKKMEREIEEKRKQTDII